MEFLSKYNPFSNTASSNTSVKKPTESKDITPSAGVKLRSDEITLDEDFFTHDSRPTTPLSDAQLKKWGKLMSENESKIANDKKIRKEYLLQLTGEDNFQIMSDKILNIRDHLRDKMEKNIEQALINTSIISKIMADLIRISIEKNRTDALMSEEMRWKNSRKFNHLFNARQKHLTIEESIDKAKENGLDMRLVRNIIENGFKYGNHEDLINFQIIDLIETTKKRGEFSILEGIKFSNLEEIKFYYDNAIKLLLESDIELKVAQKIVEKHLIDDIKKNLPNYDLDSEILSKIFERLQDKFPEYSSGKSKQESRETSFAAGGATEPEMLNDDIGVNSLSQEPSPEPSQEPSREQLQEPSKEQLQEQSQKLPQGNTVFSSYYEYFFPSKRKKLKKKKSIKKTLKKKTKKRSKKRTRRK